LGICRHVPVLVGRTRQAESFALLFVSYQSLSWLWFWVCNSWLLFSWLFTHTLARWENHWFSSISALIQLNARYQFRSTNFSAFFHGALLDFHDRWFVLSVVKWIQIAWRRAKLANWRGGLDFEVNSPPPAQALTHTHTQPLTQDSAWKFFGWQRLNWAKLHFHWLPYAERRPKAAGARGFSGVESSNAAAIACWW